MRAILILVTLGAALSGSLAQQPAIRRDGYAPELVNLQTDYRKAMDGYYAPLERARTDEERMKVRLDPAKDPSRRFIPRFQALARRAAGTDTGARALLTIIEIDRSDAPTTASARALEDLIALYSRNRIVEEAAESLRYVPPGVGKPRALAALNKIVSRSPIRSARATALLNIARITLDEPSATEAAHGAARKTLERLRRDFGDTRAGRAACHELFAIENLQVGMTAPDFDAVDEEGNRFRLSDYRGKVVVLDFWGFW